MKINENRIKQIIVEEINKKIILTEIRTVMSEMGLNLSQEQQIIIERSVLDALKSVSAKVGIPLLVLAKLAFGGEVANRVMDLQGVGVSPSAAEQINNAVEVGQKMSDSRIDMLQKSI